MALLYPWATKEYCLWSMSWSQLIMYHNIGCELKYGKKDESQEVTKPSEMSYEQLSKLKESLRKQYGEVD